MMMKKMVLAMVLAMPVMGCHSTVTAPAPPLVNQVNEFDGDSFRTLMTLQAALNTLSAQIKADPNLAGLKPVVNQAIMDFNIAQASWKVYHAAAAAGGATVAQQNAVTAGLATTQKDVNQIQGQVVGK